jgi:tetratricopeptide (TPR) repeat protein
MKPMRAIRFALATAVGLAAAAWLAVVRPSQQLRADQRANAEVARRELALRTADIALYERRAAEDPMSAEDRAMAAGLYLQRAREGGGRDDYRRAEALAAQSLALRSEHNGKARLVLSSALLAQHRFRESLQEARMLVASAPHEARYRALLAELHVEMGSYDSAKVQFDSLRGALSTLAVAPRYARYLEFIGSGARGRRILQQAMITARGESELPREQVAWFAVRLGDAELRAGRLEAAESAIREGLRFGPTDPRLLALRARLNALRGAWRAVLDDIDAIGEDADLATMSLAGDAWAALGDSTRASASWAATERAALANPEPFNRQWTMFRLEHRVRLDETRGILEREILERHDVYGWAQLAWARLLTGEAAAARSAIEQAMRLGTTDAWLWHLAAEIALATGSVEEGRRWREKAIELNPHFHHRRDLIQRAMKR